MEVNTLPGHFCIIPREQLTNSFDRVLSTTSFEKHFGWGRLRVFNNQCGSFLLLGAESFHSIMGSMWHLARSLQNTAASLAKDSRRLLQCFGVYDLIGAMD